MFENIYCTWYIRFLYFRVEEDKIKLVNDGECFDSNHSKGKINTFWVTFIFKWHYSAVLCAIGMVNSLLLYFVCPLSNCVIYDMADPCLDPTYAKANTDCHSTKHPVCGANGRTYENWRQLQQENDQRQVLTYWIYITGTF